MILYIVIICLVLNYFGRNWWEQLFSMEFEAGYKPDFWDKFIAYTPVLNFVIMLLLIIIAHVIFKDE